MTSVLLMLLLSLIRPQRVSPVPSCPASCVVCSEDAVICHRLAHIIDAPDTTQALLLTEGSISTVQPASLSDLSNITVIGLSHNHISVLGEQSFRNLPFLHSLLLDHNLLTSQALQGGALASLTQLEVLALGHNLITMIQGSWLKGSKALRSLKLEGNLLTSLDSGSFPLDDLKDLESLDLSDNLIDHLDRNSFGGLVSLRTLDLSRNRLGSAPAEAFSYLSWLTNLDLDLNSWNCSCQLLELAAFLSAFIQQPDKTLYNGRRMVCVSADNPAVTTVLELTDANCVPSNQNITVRVEPRGGVTPQLYARDLAITAVICFMGGVGLTLLVVLIYYQVSRRKKLKESKRQKQEEEGSSTVENHHVNHMDVSEKRRDFSLQAHSGQPWDRDTVTSDARTNGHGGQFRSRADENGSHFRCPDCSMEGQRGTGLNPMRNIRINGGMEAEEERERRRMRLMAEEERRRLGTGQGILGRDIPNQLLSHGNTNSSSHPRKETFSQRPETLAAHKTSREMGESHGTDVEGKSRGHETFHCESCHRTYRPPEQNTRQRRTHSIMRDSALFDGFPFQNREMHRGRNVNHNQSDMMKTAESRRETRNVTFDLGRLKTLERKNSQDEDKREEEERTSRDKERGRVRRHKAKVQSSRLVKVKLNLNPLRKSKVHPKSKTEQSHSEKRSPKKSQDKRQDGKERGEKEGKRKSGKKMKCSSEKIKKSTKTIGSTEDGEEEKEEEVPGEGGPKSKTSSKQKKITSKRGQGRQESSEGDKGENTHPENSQPADTTNTADQSASAVVTGQGQNLQGGSAQYQGAGLVLGSAQLSSQHPLSLSATDRNHTTNLSMLGSQQSFLLSTMAPGPNALFPSYPANSVAPSMAISGPNMAPSGAPDGFSRKAGVGLMTPATSLLANSVHANPLQASVIHTSPFHTSQPAGLASNSNPAPVQLVSQSQPPLESSRLVARQKSDPAQGPGLQTSEGLHQLPPECQAPQTKESITLPTQPPPSVDGLSGVTPHAPGPVTTVENLSNDTKQAETGVVPAGTTVSMSAGAVALTEGLAAGLSGGSMQAADVSVSGVTAPSVSTQSVSSTGDPGLLQQEYLSEEGGSSPRRKLRLVLPEKTASRPPTALERKIR